MNVILIPFFLAANMAFDDVTHWKFGPEYSYDVYMTYNVREDPFEPIIDAYLNSTVKCRPADSKTLFCRLYDVTTMGYLTNREVEALKPSKAFTIRFNERGVEILTIKPPFSVQIANVIRKIVNQFSVNADRIRTMGIESIPDFKKMENTSMGICTTVYAVKHDEPNVGEKRDKFLLQVPPISVVKFDTNISIDKIRKRCANSPRLDDIFDDEAVFEMTTFNTTISINARFETYTELNGYAKFTKKPSSNKNLLFKEVIRTNLIGIKPAQDELPLNLNGEIVNLSINTDIPDSTN